MRKRAKRNAVMALALFASAHSVVRQVQADMKADRPIVILAFDRIIQRLPLGVALYARIAGAQWVQPGGIDDVGA